MRSRRIWEATKLYQLDLRTVMTDFFIVHRSLIARKIIQGFSTGSIHATVMLLTEDGKSKPSGTYSASVSARS
jgi:hypothetical protein